MFEDEAPPPASVTRKVRAFYERHPFPGSRPIDRDGLILLRRVEAAVKRRLEGRRRGVPKILDAGCGTGATAVSLARQFPALKVLGIDHSKTSLQKARTAARALRLKNLRFMRWNLVEPLEGEAPFDLVLCLGVLHHTASMGAVLRNLAGALRSDGELFLWIYGRHGRYRHSLNCRLLALLRSVPPRDADPVRLAQELFGQSPEGEARRDLLGNSGAGALQERAFTDPVWIADQFLNPHETLLDMEGLLRLTASAGLGIKEAVGMNDPAARRLLSPALEERFQRLSPRKRLLALDLILKPERYFMILSRSRHRKGG